MNGPDTRFRAAVIITVLFAFLVSCKTKAVHSFERPPVAIGAGLKDEYMGLYFHDRKLGYFHGSAAEATVGGKKAYYLSGDAVVRVDVNGETLFTVLKEEVILDSAYRALYFSYSQKIGESSMNIVAVRSGDGMVMRSLSGGKTQEETLPDEVLPLASAGFIVWKEGIAEGKRHQFRVFVEALQKIETLTVTVGKKTKDGDKIVFPLKQKLGNIEITTLVLENGDTFREESLQGFTMKKLTKEEALRFEEGAISLYDIFSFSYVPVDVSLDRPFTELVVEVSGVDATVPSGPHQKVERKKDISLVTLTASPSATPPPADLTPFLAPTAKVQKDDPEIAGLAKTITAGAGTNEEKARRIADWVHKNIRKRLRDKSSALEVLKSREGECEAHAMLTAALMRSAGLPAKIVGGLAWSKEYGGFLFHAWNEVYYDGLFTPVDATFGEFPAKPYHLKLTEERNMEDVVLFLGKVRLKVVSVR